MNRLLTFLISVFSISAFGAVLNVTNYGAWGDAINFTVNCISNSYTVTTTNILSSTDAGKVIIIFGGGEKTDYNPTNHQDLVAIITSVNNATNLTLNRPAGCTTNLALAIYGTCSSTGLQAAIGAAVLGDIIQVPAGRYLVIPPVFDTNWLWGTARQSEGAVYVRKGGISIVGDDRNNTVLIGNGAFQKTKDGSVYRGMMFVLGGPFTNGVADTLSFDSLTMDGGVSVGRTSNRGFPANVHDGDGWDWTHDAILVNGSALPFPLCTNTLILNCTFQHWRGEMLKSVVDECTGDFYGITNCLFQDGNASAMNIMFGNAIKGCTFTNLDLLLESYESISAVPLYFGYNHAMNMRAGITIQGARTDRQPQAPYLIEGNDMQCSQAPFNLGPAQNVIIRSNYLHDSGAQIIFGIVGGQGTASISNIVYADNIASNCASITIYNGNHLYFTNNTSAFGAGNFNFADGNWSDVGIWFVGNTVIKGPSGSQNGLSFPASAPMLPFDDLSNVFPYYQLDDFSGDTNKVSYQTGARQVIRTAQASSVWCLDDSVPSRIPTGARMIVSNACGSTVRLYRSTRNQVPPIIMINGYSTELSWTNGVWRTLFSPAWAPNLQVIPPPGTP